MTRPQLLLTGIATLGVFGLGYVAGRSAKPGDAGEAPASTVAASSSTTARHAEDIATHDHSATKPKPRSATTDPVPAAEKGFSRRIVAMMSSGELAVNGVSIDGQTLLPGEKAKDFLGLTDEQLETMKQMGRDRLQARQDHERSLVANLESADNEISFDVPADPAFAQREKAAFTEAVRKEFGPDVAAVLQTSIAQAYGEFDFPRHVRYTLGPNPNTIPEDAPPEIRTKIDGVRTFNIAVNQNRDGTFMTDAQGTILTGAQSASGSVDIGNAKPDAWVPRYHYLLDRVK